MAELDDRTPEELSSARLMFEIYDRRSRGESWESIASWTRTVKL
jgi:hypothetical protein